MDNNIILKAESGDAEAQCYLGAMYRDGKGVLINYEQALIWTKKAAEQGNMVVLHNLRAMCK